MKKLVTIFALLFCFNANAQYSRSAMIARIVASIYTNPNHKITGDTLQHILRDMTNSSYNIISDAIGGGGSSDSTAWHKGGDNIYHEDSIGSKNSNQINLIVNNVRHIRMTTTSDTWTVPDNLSINTPSGSYTQIQTGRQQHVGHKMELYGNGSGQRDTLMFFEPEQDKSVNMMCPDTVKGSSYTIVLPDSAPGTNTYLKHTTGTTFKWDTIAASGGGSGTVTSIATGYGLSGGTITTTGTLLVDSGSLHNYFLAWRDTLNKIASVYDVGDTAQGGGVNKLVAGTNTTVTQTGHGSWKTNVSGNGSMFYADSAAFHGNANITTVGALVSGSIAAGFTTIDTARTNAVGLISSGTGITATKTGKSSYSITEDTSSSAGVNKITATYPISVTTSGHGSRNLTIAPDTIAIEFSFGGGTSAVDTGGTVYVEVPFNCTIIRATMLSDISTTSTVQLWKDTYANHPPVLADKIYNATPPTITTALKSQDATLSGWTTTITTGDILAAHLSLNNNAKSITVSLKCVKN